MPTDTLPTHESLERAFKDCQEAISKLPDSVESREAKRLLTVAEELTHAARERGRREAD